MPRSTASIQAQITATETALLAATSLASTQADGTGVTNQRITDLQSILDRLYIQLDRLSGASPMFVRGRLSGLGRN